MENDDDTRLWGLWLIIQNTDPSRYPYWFKLVVSGVIVRVAHLVLLMSLWVKVCDSLLDFPTVPVKLSISACLSQVGKPLQLTISSTCFCSKSWWPTCWVKSQSTGQRGECCHIFEAWWHCGISVTELQCQLNERKPSMNKSFLCQHIKYIGI